MNDSVISHALKGLIKFVSVTRLSVDDIDSRLGKVEGSVGDLDISDSYALSEIRSDVDNTSEELRAEIEDMSGTVSAMENSISDLESAQDYFDLGEFDQFTDLADDVKGNAEELSLQEHRIGSIETKLDGEIVSIKDLASRLNNAEHDAHAGSMARSELATRLNRLEQTPYWDKDTESIEAQITDAIHKLYEMHGMEIDFSMEPKGGDDE